MLAHHIMQQLSGLISLLMMASMSSLAVAQPSKPACTRTVKFATGETTIVSGADKDHVVVKDAQGKVTAESWCNSGTFDAYLALFTKLKESTGRGDRAAVVTLVAYPFRVNGGKRLAVENEGSLSKAYPEVFTSQVVQRIQKAEPAAVFCRDGQAMLGDGVVWARAAGGTAKATIVNR